MGSAGTACALPLSFLNDVKLHCALPLSFPNDVKLHLSQLTTYPDQGYVEAGFCTSMSGTCSRSLAVHLQGSAPDPVR
jgi:hypothetical protein